MSPNAIPVATINTVGQGSRSSGRSRGEVEAGVNLSLTLLDKKTGKPIGETVTASFQENYNPRFVLDLQAWPGKLIVLAGSSRLIFPMTGSSPAARTGRDDAQTMDSTARAVSGKAMPAVLEMQSPGQSGDVVSDEAGVQASMVTEVEP